MRYFVDTEFEEYGARKPIRLISIGIVAEDGREYYAEVCGVDLWIESDWINDNVLKHLIGGDAQKRYLEIAPDIKRFIGDDPEPEFWGYYCDYDYVVFANIFGGIAGWPKGWPYLFYDLRQALDFLGLTSVVQDDSGHNALNDARWVAETFKRWQTALGPAEITA